MRKDKRLRMTNSLEETPEKEVLKEKWKTNIQKEKDDKECPKRRMEMLRA